MDISEGRVYKAKAMKPNTGEHVSGHGAGLSSGRAFLSYDVSASPPRIKLAVKCCADFGVVSPPPHASILANHVMSFT
jgi:hypothetical protein